VLLGLTALLRLSRRSRNRTDQGHAAEHRTDAMAKVPGGMIVRDLRQTAGTFRADQSHLKCA
jgi:hypothetical protein